MKSTNADGRSGALNARFELFLTLFVRPPARRRRRTSRKR